MATVSEVAARWQHLKDQIDRVVLGQDKVKEQMLVCLLSGGHGLLEGVPGTGKTLLVLTLARLLDCRFRRIQFTSDLMPADLLGTNIFNPKDQDFEFRAGPIFTDLLLADEVNRTPPRTQAALLESMQERAVTIDGVRRIVSPVFSVFATQNPVEFEGTYPLPEAQRDRFLLKINIDYPSLEAESAIVAAYSEGRRLHEAGAADLQPVLNPEQLQLSRQVVSRQVRFDAALRDYLLAIVTATRQHAAVHVGAGPRASIASLDSSRSLALLRGRDFVTPDDIKELAAPVLEHRLIMNPEAEMEGFSLDDLLRQIFEQTPVPR